MGISEDIFESAIALSDQVDNRGHPTKLRQILNMDAVLKFPESMFLQLLCNLVQLNMEKSAVRDNPVSFKSRDAMFEVGRTLRILQLYPMKNSALGNLFKDKLLEAFMSLEQLRDADVETLCFLNSEMRVQSHMYSG